ncbi:MAG: hypothetical protein GC192_05485 [Bacteroidetes bacterium]|nr:hypothetical protein [Bacteroidota bacterium]
MPFGYSSVTPKEHRERKPFQAFQSANDLRKKKALEYDIEHRIGNPWKEANEHNWINKLVGIVVLCLVLLGAFFIWRAYLKFTQYETNRKAVIQRNQRNQANPSNDILIKSGFNNLYAGDLKHAKLDFENVLKIDANSFKAADGLVKVLNKYCETKNIFCVEAAQWQQYLNKLTQAKKMTR